uniref:Protein FAM184A/B N-terminal domain-containing protein n=1 Tax=Gadus morhua TaxID=8049 RepID=A0A8C5FUF2_GADMO
MASGGGSGWQTPCSPPIVDNTSRHTRTSSCAAAMSREEGGGGWSLEYTQDLHLKMSKKIAQLTKVIYALNTKNDEHEEEMEALKDSHEDEVQHIVTETRDKIMQFKNKMADEADLRRRLASLEESVEMHEHMKRQALAEFDMYRQRIEDAQICTEAQHTQRVVSMSREVEEMRRDFEEKLRSFGQTQATVEGEKRRALEELRASHRGEVEALLHAQQHHSASSSEEQEKQAETHRHEVESLMERVEQLTRDKVHLVEEYEGQLAKAQDFYERELEGMRRTHQLTAENLLAWKHTEVELRKEFQLQEVALQRSLAKLRCDLQRAQEEARENRDKANRLQTSLTNNLHQQLSEAVQDGEIWVMQLKDTEDELEHSRDRVQQQAGDILHKASQIGSLQATQMSHETTIRDLDQEQGRLKEAMSRLEGEREALLNQSQAADDAHRQQVLKLEQVRVSGWEGPIQANGRVMKRGVAFCLTLAVSLGVLLVVVPQVSHLQEQVRESEHKLGSAQGQIGCLKDTQEKLKVELDATRGRVRETSNLLTDLQEEIESEKQQHEARLLSIRTEEKQRMDKMADDLDLKWTEISLLKQSLELQLSQSQAALQQLQSQFNQEREQLSQQLKGKVCSQALVSLESVRIESALEERLKQEQREEVQALKEAHRRTLEILRQQSEQELQTLRYELEDEGKAMLASLRSELNHLHATAVEHLKQIHLKENSVAKKELENTLHHSHEQEQELLGRISALQGDVCSRSNRITALDHEIHSLNQTIDTLTRELELKGKEVLRVRSESSHQIRWGAHEQDLGKRHERELGELSGAHHRETHIMLADFNKAQEALKDKITALQILLEGTEDKFRNRESRPEDLAAIAELRAMVTERETLVKKLVDDKKFYQLELVNRETGFSKVFNSSANVGVINPLVKVSLHLDAWNIGPGEHRDDPLWSSYLLI